MQIPTDDQNIIDKLTQLAKRLRKDVLWMVKRSGEGHLGAAFSSIEILVTLYFEVMRINPSMPDWPDRDWFVMSKGHGCFGQYAALARRGFFSPDVLAGINGKDSMLGGHPDRDKVPGIDVSTGSLGHGLSVACGVALAAKKDGRSSRIFVLLGDGECQEGAVWEAAMFASANSLDNLVAIIDVNSLQAIGSTDDVISLKPFGDKWASFGWEVDEVQGHNYAELLTVLSKPESKEGKPIAIIARTIKGKGVSYMENEIMWHARPVTEEEFKQAMIEIDGTTPILKVT